MKRRVAIVGGGLAGIAAAVRLAEHDCAPIVIESRKRLGGRATSLLDPRSGRVVDNCQHVLMGCCTNLIDLYERLGVLDDIEWHRTFHWTDGGSIGEMKAGWLPAPFHFTGALRRMGLFDRHERRAIARAMWRMIRLGPRGRLAWRDRTFAEFLDACDQPEAVVRRFWSTVVVSACNLDVTRVAGDVALQVFQDGFLANRWSSTMGLPAGPLVSLYDPAAELIASGGGAIVQGTSAKAIAFDGSRVTGVVTADGLVEASAVVSAVPFDRLARLVSDVARRVDGRLARLDQLDVSPILGVHLVFERAVMSRPHLTLVDLGVQWLFDKGVDADGRQHLHAVISAADAWMDLDEATIAARVTADIHRVLPCAVGLEPLEVRAIKEKRATFAATPGSDRRRPPAAPGTIGVAGGGIPNLFLAGDWCDTGWPATMEGAVRSGYLAAHAVTGEGGLVPDVPCGLVARLLGMGQS